MIEERFAYFSLSYSSGMYDAWLVKRWIAQPVNELLFVQLYAVGFHYYYFLNS